MRQPYPRLSALMLLSLVAAGCSSPVSFEATRDAQITVLDAQAEITPNQFVHAELDVTIQNLGSAAFTFLGECGPLSLEDDEGRSFDISQPCIELGGTLIEPGEQLVTSVFAGRPRETWGEVVAGEYRLTAGVSVEGGEYFESVTSDPFTVAFDPY